MSNELVVTRALQGKSYDNAGRAFHTQHIEFPGEWIHGAGASWLPRRIANILSQRNREGRVTQVILSYNTPIAWLDGDVWIVPDATYSITTSSKHMSQLYRLSNVRYVPVDAGYEEYERVVQGKLTYHRGYGRKLGTYTPGPNA
jgi:hypothetical protein